ncbi:hypothetical protein [Pseudomonas sp. HLMP]|uniref:hypothetical protein n=1 Tax=Pseudomonas sp. HLMP TaxID=3153767 RepID=UPI003966C1FC
MPIENRSSNTDMISVPRELAESAAKWLEIHFEGPSAERSVADELRKALAQPAEQHHGEPVAYAVFADNGNIRIWSTNCEAVGIKVMQEEGKHAVPLFTHATPGEVERLRAENIRLIEDRARFPDRPDDIGRMITCHIGNLKNQTKSAEDYARKWRWELEASDRKLAELSALCWGLIGSSGKKRAQYLEKLQDTISASAEPSAPVEHDERAAFERHVILTTGRPIDSELKRHPPLYSLPRYGGQGRSHA